MRTKLLHPWLCALLLFATTASPLSGQDSEAEERIRQSIREIEDESRNLAERAQMVSVLLRESHPLALQELLTDASRNVDRLLVDLSAVDLIASSGLAVLVSVQKNLRPGGKAIVLREPRPFVRKMLHTVGFDEMLGLV